MAEIGTKGKWESWKFTLDAGGWLDVAEAAMTRLYSDKDKHIREEAERMAMLEEHWDVMVAEIS